MSWLEILSILALATGFFCALVIAVDVYRHPQKMFIMNLVWPITALYAGPLALWAYFRVGRKPADQHSRVEAVGLAAMHCGSGCTLADIVAEWTLFFFPLALFGRHIFGSWVVDFALAFLFGIIFQYYTIKPMKNLEPAEGLWAALKADTLSLTAWQVGMYGWMALATFGLFGHELDKTDPLFWFMMQVAMLVGFLFSYPINWWLVESGIKEAM